MPRLEVDQKHFFFASGNEIAQFAYKSHNFKSNFNSWDLPRVRLG